SWPRRIDCPIAAIGPLIGRMTPTLSAAAWARARRGIGRPPASRPVAAVPASTVRRLKGFLVAAFGWAGLRVSVMCPSRVWRPWRSFEIAIQAGACTGSINYINFLIFSNFMKRAARPVPCLGGLLSEALPVVGREMAEMEKAPFGRDLGDALSRARVEELGSDMAQADRLQMAHRRRVAEAAKAFLQRARADAGNRRQVGHRDRRVRVSRDVFLRAPHVIGRRRRGALHGLVVVIVRLG